MKVQDYLIKGDGFNAIAQHISKFLRNHSFATTLNNGINRCF